MSNLRILIISQYFWPENFRVNELSEELNKLGHKVTILTGYPNYPSGKFLKNSKKTNLNFMNTKVLKNKSPITARKIINLIYYLII